MCKVSVITTVYNGEKFIGEAIESILNQTFADFEYIILDNCSTDKTVDVIKRYSDKRIRFVQNEKNLGMPLSLNRGLARARGDYIARLDADDICYLDRLQIQVDYLDANPKVALCSGGYDYYKNGKIVGEFRTDMLLPEEMKFIQPFINYVSHPSVMFRGDVIRENNLQYDERYKLAQDYKLWMQISDFGGLVILNEKLIKYRIHDDNFSKHVDRMSAEVQEIVCDNIDYLDIDINKKNILKNGYNGKITSCDEIYKVGMSMLEYFYQCGMSLEKNSERALIEHAYYSLLMNYTHLGLGVYLAARKTGIFSGHSSWGKKLLIKSLMKWKGI